MRPLILTSHAVEQFASRHRPDRSVAEARAELEAMLPRAVRTSTTKLDGARMWIIDGVVGLLVRENEKRLVVLTVLPKRATAHATGSVATDPDAEIREEEDARKRDAQDTRVRDAQAIDRIRCARQTLDEAENPRSAAKPSKRAIANAMSVLAEAERLTPHLLREADQVDAEQSNARRFG